MSRTGCYTTIRAADDERTSLGARILEYEEFTEYMETVSLEAVVSWRADDPDAYPKNEYAHLEGFEHPRQDVTLRTSNDTFTLHNIAHNRKEFWEFWPRIAAVCEPFTVLHSPEENVFPRSHDIALGRRDAHILRLSGEPNSLTVSKVPLSDTKNTEVLHEFEWEDRDPTSELDDWFRRIYNHY